MAEATSWRQRISRQSITSRRSTQRESTAPGQKIVIAGQTDILLSDLRSFRTQFKLPAKDPKLVLFGSDPGFTGDLVEADLDLEWSGAVAPNATIVYVYSLDVFVSAQYCDRPESWRRWSA